MMKYYSEKTIRDFIEDCQDINGRVDIDMLDRYLDSRFTFEADDDWLKGEKEKERKILKEFSDWYGDNFGNDKEKE